jgi:hypothetical protein
MFLEPVFVLLPMFRDRNGALRRFDVQLIGPEADIVLK